MLLKTDEISAKVVQQIQVTRPQIVDLIMRRCEPSRQTIGLSVIQLSEDNARALDYEIERESRRHPIVEVSCDRDGRFLVDPERLRSVLVGLAQVVEVPSTVDTFQIEKILGRRYSAFGGAINIIYFYRAKGRALYRTELFTPERMQDRAEAGHSIDSEILGIVTHQTNLPHSWRHISKENVRGAILRGRIQKALAARGSTDFAVYEELLTEASERLAAKDTELNDAKTDLKDREEGFHRVEAENDILRHGLSSLQTKLKNKKAGHGLSQETADALKAVLGCSPSLEQALLAVDTLYPDRLAILDNAYSSARDSDRAGFQHGNKAFRLLKKLAEEYWTDLRGGKGDQQAKNRFGKNEFAAKEAETLSSEGRRRRTFKYKHRDVLMEKHLKFGVKDSLAETLRVHFEWLPEEQLILIGHCGKHLDF